MSCPSAGESFFASCGAEMAAETSRAGLMKRDVSAATARIQPAAEITTRMSFLFMLFLLLLLRFVLDQPGMNWVLRVPPNFRARPYASRRPVSISDGRSRSSEARAARLLG